MNTLNSGRKSMIADLRSDRSAQISFLIVLAVSVSASAFADEPQDETKVRPNVIVIVTDDQGYGDMSCHGNPWLKTPNLDRLCAEGVSFENYHVDPICTPTRAALMTGRYSTRVGAWDVIQGRQLLAPEEKTMADVFSESGYRTAMFGKWHLGDTWPYAPRYRGFQDVVRHLAGGIDEIGNPIGNDYFDDTYYRNGVAEKIDGYCTDVFFAEWQRFATAVSDQPFFIYLPLNAMHGPHTVAEKYSDPFRAEGHAEKRSKFFGQIINFDENLGRLFDALQKSQLEENTLVIFMGDNGTAEGSNGRNPDDGFNAGMRGKKASVYEGGHRVACFARWPGQLDTGKQVRQLTSCRDWLPTLIDLCGLDAVDTKPLDGQSLKPLLVHSSDDLDAADDWPSRTLFVQRQPDQPRLLLDANGDNPWRSPHYGVLTETWRLVDGELYDIGEDPGQTTNLAKQHADVVEDLKARYRQHFADVFRNDAPYVRFQLGDHRENPTLLTVRDWHPTKGGVIWKQEQLADDTRAINGFWAVNVTQNGRYAIRLARFPDDSPASMGATKAVLRLGDRELVKQIHEDDISVSFEMDLPAGPAILQSWLSDDQGVVRGAYFVRARKL